MLQPDSQLYTPCTKMSVVQMPPNGALSGPYECELRIGDGINVDIQQIFGRRIEIIVIPPRPCFEVFNSFQDIKKNQPRHFSGKDCVRYSMKFSLLYRRILLDLLDVPYEAYIARLRHAVQVIDEWLK